MDPKIDIFLVRRLLIRLYWEGDCYRADSDVNRDIRLSLYGRTDYAAADQRTVLRYQYYYLAGRNYGIIYDGVAYTNRKRSGKRFWITYLLVRYLFQI